jgi:hypothetical protein
MSTAPHRHGWSVRRAAKRLRVAWASAGVLFVAMCLGTMAADPHIDRIELAGTRQVTIHFGTDANRTYYLQYRNDLCEGTNAACSGSWSNLFVIPPFPRTNHYVYPDTRTNQHRFYRLAATP